MLDLFEVIYFLALSFFVYLEGIF